MSLPVARLRDAGAHETEIAHLEAEHDQLDARGQRSREDHFASIATEDIREWLKTIRAGGHFQEPEPTEHPQDPAEGTPLTDEHKAQADKPHDQDKPATRAKK